MIEIHGAQEIANNLDSIADAVDSVLGIEYLRVFCNLIAAILAFALMINMTKEAGLSGLKPLMRLVQRCSLGWLSFSLLLRASTPLVTPGGSHNALIGLLTSASLLFLFSASLVLVGINPEHREQNENLRARDAR